MRPVNAVYQLYAVPSTTVAESEMNTLFVGPCYHIVDYDSTHVYVDNKLTANYGVRRAYTNLPTAVTATSYPDNEASTVVDTSSVDIYFDPCDLRVIDTTAVHTGCTLANFSYFWDKAGTFTPKTDLVAAGDYTLINLSPEVDLPIKNIMHAFYSTDPAWVLTDVKPGYTLVLSADHAATTRNGTYTVLEVFTGSVDKIIIVQETQPAENGISANVDFAFYDLNGAPVAGTGGADKPIMSLIMLNMTQPFVSTNSATLSCRIIHSLTSITLASTDYTPTASGISINAGLTYSVYNSKSYVIDYGEIYVQYKALRTTLNVLTKYTSNDVDAIAGEITGLGKIDYRNPLCRAVYIGLLNCGGTSVYGMGVIADNGAGHLDAQEKSAYSNDFWAIVPLTEDQTIIGSWKTHCTTYADPALALSTSVSQKFKHVISAVPFAIDQTMCTKSSSGSVIQKVNSSTGSDKTLTMAGAAWLADLFTLGNAGSDGAIPGCTVTFKISGVDTTFTIAHVKSGNVIEVEETVGAALYTMSGGAGTDQFELKDPAGVSIKVIVTGGTGNPITATRSANDNLYLILRDPNATFITDGVIAGDYIEIPPNADDSTFVFSATATVYRYLVDSITNEQELIIANNGDDTPDESVELPHEFTRVYTSAAPDLPSAITSTAIVYQVVRDYTKADLLTYIKNVAYSSYDKRVTTVFPFRVDLQELDGTIIVDQPGYYMAAVQGGLSSGLPSHQPLNEIGVNGIYNLQYSNNYFSEAQLTDLANHGVCVFKQDVGGLPYCIYQTTTKYGTTDETEFSVVKNFDYISKRFSAVLNNVKGKWNIYEDAFAWIRQGIRSEIDRLKGKRYAQIGSSLISATIVSLEVTDYDDTRLKLVINVNMPRPLNGIDIYLVSV